MKVQKPSTLMIYRTIGNVTDPQKSLLLALALHNNFDKYKTDPTWFLNDNISGTLRITEVESVGKDAYRKILENRRIHSWKSRIWDEYAQKNMRWKFNTFQLNGRNLNNSELFISIGGIPLPSPFRFPRCFRERLWTSPVHHLLLSAILLSVSQWELRRFGG